MSELCVYPTLSTFSCQHLLGNSSHSNVKSLQAIAFFVGGFSIPSTICLTTTTKITDLISFRKYIEKDAALERRFQQVHVEDWNSIRSTPENSQTPKEFEPKRLPTEMVAGVIFLGPHVFLVESCTFSINYRVFCLFVLQKKDPSNGRGTFVFPLLLGSFCRSPRCRRPWRFCVASKTGMLHTMGSASRTRR